MNEINLFLSKKGNWVTNISLLETLLSIGADKCDILYIHTSLSFGQPNLQLKKSTILYELLDVIKSLGVKTICMPTFTFSFCNGLDYNPATSISKMGVLNEFFRKQDGVVRSGDPLMSVALIGEDKDLVMGIGHASCGENSTFDKLHHRDNVKFLFLGPKIGDCMTYMHYMEWLYSVDYRYNRMFRGNVIIDGKTSVEEYELFVRYNSVVPNAASYIYEQKMYDNRTALLAHCGDGTISVVDEKNASIEYKKCLDENPYYFVDFTNGAFNKDKTFKLSREMVAM
ncbi:MAG: AAC(3) family N-acetyltransferase [Bacteroidales bacterium]|nr:AAC(3) family N-acetyltransferase [Bacteroidales bacterium]